MTTGKTIQIFVGKAISLLFNMLSKVGHSSSSKEEASFNFMAAVTIHNNFGAQENKVSHCCNFLPHLFAMKLGAGCHDLSFVNVEF